MQSEQKWGFLTPISIDFLDKLISFKTFGGNYLVKKDFAKYLTLDQPEILRSVSVEFVHLNIFLIFSGNICHGYTLEVISYEHPQHIFSWRNKKISIIFVEKNYFIQCYKHVIATWSESMLITFIQSPLFNAWHAQTVF